MIYEEHLMSQSHTPAEIIHEQPLSTLRLVWRPTLLAVSRQINDEISDLFRKQTTSTHRISWQEARFDGPSICSFRARDQKPEHGMEHLRVEIYPPHEDRPMDMVHIWRGLEELRDALEYLWRPERLSILFMENESASWSQNGRLRDSMDLSLFRSRSQTCAFSDISYAFDILETVDDIPDVSVHLTVSLRCLEEVQEWRTIIVDDMMALPAYGEVSVIQNREFHTRQIDKAEIRLKEATGKSSRAIIEDICDHGRRKISPEELHRLKQIWPYTDVLPDSIGFPDSKNAGLGPNDLPSDPPASPKLWTAAVDKALEQKKALPRAIMHSDW